jgi:lipopolysaccharide transport system permease protein
LGWHPTYTLIYFPFVLIDLMVVGFAVGLLFHSIFSMIADFSRLVAIALQFLMYVSAVIFPKPKTEGLASLIFNLNPLSHLVTFSRDIFAGVPLESTLEFTVISIFSIALLVFSLIMYRITMPIIIERMGS